MRHPGLMFTCRSSTANGQSTTMATTLCGCVVLNWIRPKCGRLGRNSLNSWMVRASLTVCNHRPAVLKLVRSLLHPTLHTCLKMMPTLHTCPSLRSLQIHQACVCTGDVFPTFNYRHMRLRLSFDSGCTAAHYAGESDGLLGQMCESLNR